MVCPANTLNISGGPCLCPPGQYSSSSGCTPYPFPSSMAVSSSIRYSPPTSIVLDYSTASLQQTIFITTAALIAAWIVAGCALRCFPLGNGNRPGGGLVYRLRYFMSRLDRRYHRRHWIDEQKVVVKRRTELGGMCSVASYIFMVGLILGSLLSYILSNSTTSQTLVPTNGRDVVEIKPNLTFVTQALNADMRCSQLACVGCTSGTNYSFLVGSASATDLRALNLEELGIVWNCTDAPAGPLVTLVCNNCAASRDLYYFEVTFVDRPPLYAVASGFYLRVTSDSYYDNSNQVKSTTTEVYVNGGGAPTNVLSDPSQWGYFRGGEPNRFVLRLLPRTFEQEQNVSFIQPSFDSFVPGGTFSLSSIAASFAPPPAPPALDSTERYLAMAFSSHILSGYRVITVTYPKIDWITFVSSLGSLVGISISIFFLAQLQVEIRCRWMAYDDNVLLIRNRVWRRRQHWKKLRNVVFAAAKFKRAQEMREAAWESSRFGRRSVADLERTARGAWRLFPFLQRKHQQDSDRDREASTKESREALIAPSSRLGSRPSSHPSSSSNGTPFTPPSGPPPPTAPEHPPLQLPPDSLSPVPLAPPGAPPAATAGAALAGAAPTARTAAAPAAPGAPAPESAPLVFAPGVPPGDANHSAFEPLTTPVPAEEDREGAAESADTEHGRGRGAAAPLMPALGVPDPGTSIPELSIPPRPSAHYFLGLTGESGSSSIPSLSQVTSGGVTGQAAEAAAAGAATGAAVGAAAGAKRGEPSPHPVHHSASTPAAAPQSPRLFARTISSPNRAALSTAQRIASNLKPVMPHLNLSGPLRGPSHAGISSPRGHPHATTPRDGSSKEGGNLVRVSSDGGEKHAHAGGVASLFSFGALGGAIGIGSGTAEGGSTSQQQQQGQEGGQEQSGRSGSSSSGSGGGGGGSSFPKSSSVDATPFRQLLEARIQRRKARACRTYGSNTSYKGHIQRSMRRPSWLRTSEPLPGVPVLEEEDDPNTPDMCDMSVDDLLAYAQDVHAYNLRLREDFLAFETMIENVLQRFRPASDL